jgi:uncharacterized protein YukE
MAQFTVTPEELEKASKTLDGLSSEYQQIQVKLIDRASTMGKAWEAADNLAFVDQIKGFCEELKAMTDKLKLAGESLAKQGLNYSAVHDSNLAEVRKLAN